MSNEQSRTEPLSRKEIEAFAIEWYRKLDEHVPASEITPMVADQGLEFVVPEATLRSRAEFGQWCVGGGGHPGVFNLFFDEIHTLRRVAVSGSADHPTVEVVVNWQARRWRPPAPRSEWIGFDAYQTWEMIRSPVSGRPVIVRYIVDALPPMPGSPPLDRNSASPSSTDVQQSSNNREDNSMADTPPNVALVQRMYECFNRNELDTIRNEIFAPDLVWNLPGRHPLAGTKNGADEVIAFFAQLVRANIQVTLDPQSDPSTGIDTFGSDTVVEVHRGRGTVTVRDASGAESQVTLNALNCTHYRIRDGRIAQVQVYISDQHTVDNFFSTVYRLKPIPDRLAD